MARSSVMQRKPEATGQASTSSEEEIARVAYELFERRGRQHGYDQQDWFEAKQIVQRRRAQSSQYR